MWFARTTDDVQRQTAVTAYFSSEELLLFAFAVWISDVIDRGLNTGLDVH